MMQKITYAMLLIMAFAHSEAAISTINSGGAITIQYKHSESLSYKVIYQKDGKKIELPHISFADLFNAEQKNLFAAELKRSKNYSIAQNAIYVAMIGAYLAGYTCSGPVLGGAIVLGAYPFYRFRKIYRLCCLDDSIYSDFFGTGNYVQEEIDDKIVVFHKEEFSHTECSNNSFGDRVITYYYKMIGPIGYMTLKEKEKELRLVKRAARYMNYSGLLFGTMLVWKAVH